MMNKKNNRYSTHLTFLLERKLARKKRNRGNFMSQRIARRDIDNTHRVNGIS